LATLNKNPYNALIKQYKVYLIKQVEYKWKQKPYLQRFTKKTSGDPMKPGQDHPQLSHEQKVFAQLSQNFLHISVSKVFWIVGVGIGIG
jgi:hypothetical protein